MKRNIFHTLIILLITTFSLGKVSAQTLPNNTDSLLEVFQNMPDEQKESLIKMALTQLPADKKANVEESLNAMNNTIPNLKSVTYKNKQISFIPIAHASKEAFYKNVKDSVLAYKAKGYTVFYEQLKSDYFDSTKGVDTLRLKLRKIIGVEPSRQTYAILRKFFKDVVPQPQYSDLGVTNTDLNADIDTRQLIKYYEQLYGPIQLTQCDFDTKTGGLNYNCGALKNDLDPVILSYRNQNVVNLIKASHQKKILVIYGARHIPGMVQLLSE